MAASAATVLVVDDNPADRALATGCSSRSTACSRQHHVRAEALADLEPLLDALQALAEAGHA